MSEKFISLYKKALIFFLVVGLLSLLFSYYKDPVFSKAIYLEFFKTKIYIILSMAIGLVISFLGTLIYGLLIIIESFIKKSR